MKDFVITVKFRSRTHQYKIVPQEVNNNEQLFSLIANRRTILIRATNKMISSSNSNLFNKVYSYNKEEITNESLMKKVLDAIDSYMAGNVAELKPRNAIAV
jgi:hypothetical protein